MPAKNAHYPVERVGGSAHLRSPGTSPPHVSPQAAPVPAVYDLPVQVEANDTTRTELVKVIVAWLVSQGFTSSAQLLREEATAQLRDEHSQRKSLRAICRCLDEQDWEGTLKNLRKLQLRVPGSRPAGGLQTEGTSPLVTLTRTLPFLLAQQQFLELVDEDDSQRAFAFFMRSIKPLEPTLSREHFQKLTYLLTCKTVADSAATYPEFRGWTPEVGRSQLLHHIHKVAGDCLTDPYCRQGNITLFALEAGDSSETNGNGGTTTATSLKPLEAMAAQSIAYELLTAEHPQLNRARRAITIRSLSTPLTTQLPPSEPLLRLDVSQMARDILSNATAFTASPLPQPRSAAPLTTQNEGVPAASVTSTLPPRELPPLHLTACQPFLSASAIAVGTFDGLVLWLPLDGASNGAAPGSGCSLPFSTAGHMRGPHNQQPTTTSGQVCVRDGAAVVYSHTYAIKGMHRHQTRLLAWGGPQVILFDLTSRFTSSGATAPDAAGAPTWSTPWAAGSVGDTGAAKDVTHIFTHGADVTSSCFFPCGTIVAAGLTDGTVTVWDTLSGSKMFENTFSNTPIVSVLANHAGTTYYAGTKDGSICAVDVVTGMLVSTLAAPIAGELASLALSPSSTLLLSSHRGGVLRLWDVLLGEQLPYQLLGAEKSTKSSYPVTFGSQDDHVLAGSSDGCLYVWKLSSTAKATPAMGTRHAALENVPVTLQRWTQGHLVHPASQLPLHRAGIADIKVDANYLVSCAADGMVYVCSNGLRL